MKVGHRVLRVGKQAIESRADRDKLNLGNFLSKSKLNQKFDSKMRGTAIDDDDDDIVFADDCVIKAVGEEMAALKEREDAVRGSLSLRGTYQNHSSSSSSSSSSSTSTSAKSNRLPLTIVFGKDGGSTIFGLAREPMKPVRRDLLLRYSIAPPANQRRERAPADDDDDDDDAKGRGKGTKRRKAKADSDSSSSGYSSSSSSSSDSEAEREARRIAAKRKERLKSFTGKSEVGDTKAFSSTAAAVSVEKTKTKKTTAFSGKKMKSETTTTTSSSSSQFYDTPPVFPTSSSSPIDLSDENEMLSFNVR